MVFNVHEVKLSDSPRDIVLAAQAAFAAVADDTAVVDNNSVDVFVTGLSEQNRDDVLESTLFSQLAASAKFDRYKNPTEWFKAYKDILESLGWVVADFKLTERSLSNVAVSVDAIILDFLKTYLDASQLTLIQRVIKALEDAKDPAVTIFTTSSAQGNDANFQLGHCSEDKDKNVKFSVGIFTYSTDQRITNALFTKIKSGSAHFFNAFQTMILNKKHYDELRQDVHDKVIPYLKTLIKDLPLAPRRF